MKALLAAALLLCAISVFADERSEALADFNQGRFTQSAARLESLLQRAPLDAELQYTLGRVRLEQGQVEQSLPPLREAVRLALGNAEYHYRLGVALATHINHVSFFKKMGVTGEIKAAFLRAVEINPDFLDAREALMTYYLSAPGIAGGSEDKAREQAREIKQRDPVRGYLADARLLLREEDSFDEAIAAYQVAIEAAPEKTDARFELGLALQERKRYEGALTQFNGVIQRKPEEARAHYQVGKAAVLFALKGQNAVMPRVPPILR